MVRIPQFWVRAMGHMEAVDELITERYIDYLENLTDVTCRDFEDSNGFELCFSFDIKTNKYFTDELLIKIYEVPNLLLDDEPILKNVMGWNIHWKDGRSLTYRSIKNKKISKSGRRAGQICTVKKSNRNDSFLRFFR